MLRYLAIISLALWAGSAWAAPCARLDSDQKKQARKIFSKVYPYECCDEDLLRCLKAKKVCKLAKRLRDDICRRLLRRQNPKKIKNAMDRRARGATAMGKKAAIDLSSAAVAGDAKAKVTVVIYACARCPFCSKVVPDLHRKVTSGGLKGKVRIYFREFPIRTHAGSVEGGLAFIAAQQQQKYWPYLLKVYKEFDNFNKERLEEWAAALGLERAAFVKAMKSAKARKRLVQSKKEGLRNGVSATPTLFINGRKYFGDMDPETLLDVLDEEADRMAGKQFCTAKSERFFR